MPAKVQWSNAKHHSLTRSPKSWGSAQGASAPRPERLRENRRLRLVWHVRHARTLLTASVIHGMTAVRITLVAGRQERKRVSRYDGEQAWKGAERLPGSGTRSPVLDQHLWISVACGGGGVRPYRADWAGPREHGRKAARSERVRPERAGE